MPGAIMSLSKIELCGLLPHTGSMCLLAGVQSWSEREIVCTATSHRDPANPLRCNGVLPAVSGVEYAAQAMGVHGRLTAHKSAKPAAGFLASLRDVKLHAERLDDVTDTLTIEARRVADTGASVLCEFSVRAATRELLSGRALLLLELP
jgi:predicted hotdog family 3-hydroxylacyl-ACP dehydratase